MQPEQTGEPRCRECQQPFYRSRADHFFCSYACQQRWHQREYAKARRWWRELREREYQQELVGQ